MHRELLIAAGPGEWRAALLEDGKPVELRVERALGDEIGSIHAGRVVALRPALGAALVDIGGERPAFLPQSQIFPRGRRLDEGAALVVQIRREAQGGKAAQLTMAVALRGRFVELIVGRPGLAGADALTPADRGRLAAESEAAAAGLRLCQAAPIEAVAAEAGLLRARADEIAARAARIEPPARLYSASGHAAALAAVFPAAERVLIDAPAALPGIRAAFADAESAILPQAEWPIDLETLFDMALSPTIALPGGGSIHIEPARAATLIDVDTGTPEPGAAQRAALAANLAAAAAIGREIRLRNLAGGIIVDFVGLDDRGARERVRAALAAALAADPLQPQILGWTRLGHLELVRRRRTRPVAELLLELGSPVKTAVTVAYQALRAAARAARAEPGRRWQLVAAADVAAALAGEASTAVRELEQRLGRALAIAADPALPRERFQIEPV